MHIFFSPKFLSFFFFFYNSEWIFLNGLLFFFARSARFVFSCSEAFCLCNFFFYWQIPMQHYHLIFRRNYFYDGRLAVSQCGIVTDAGTHRLFRLVTCFHVNWIVESLILTLRGIDLELLKDQDNGIIPTKLPSFWYLHATQYIWIPG